MSRDSRFDKLEQPRPSAPEEQPRPSLERFAEAPETFARPVEVEAPAFERFAEDGSGGVRLENDELKGLPMRRCPACSADSTKWDTHCVSCRASLETPEAIALNRGILASLRAQKLAEQEKARAEQDEALRNTVPERPGDALGRALLEETRPRLSGRTRAGLVGLSLACLGLTFVVPFFAVRLLFFGAFAVLLAVGLPPSVWSALFQPGQRWF